MGQELNLPLGRRDPRSIPPSGPEGAAEELGKGAFPPGSPEVLIKGSWHILHTSVPAR